MFLNARRSQIRWCVSWTGEEEELNLAHLEPEFCYSPVYNQSRKHPASHIQGYCTEFHHYSGNQTERHLLDMWNVEKREDFELTEEYKKNLNHLLNAPKGPIMLIALFGVCYWWGDYIINSKVTGFAEYLMWKVAEKQKTGLVGVGGGIQNKFNNMFTASEGFGGKTFYSMYISRIIMTAIFAAFGCVKATNLSSSWKSASNTCCAYKTGCSNTKWYDRADLVCLTFDESFPFPYKVCAIWLAGFILLILCNLCEIGILIFGICRGGIEKLDIRVMAPYVATNEQINEAGAAAMVAKNESTPFGQGLLKHLEQLKQSKVSL